MTLKNIVKFFSFSNLACRLRWTSSPVRQIILISFKMSTNRFSKNVFLIGKIFDVLQLILCNFKSASKDDKRIFFDNDSKEVIAKQIKRWKKNGTNFLTRPYPKLNRNQKKYLYKMLNLFRFCLNRIDWNQTCFASSSIVYIEI